MGNKKLKVQKEKVVGEKEKKDFDIFLMSKFDFYELHNIRKF